jgi:hypothetical protein
MQRRHIERSGAFYTINIRAQDAQSKSLCSAAIEQGSVGFVLTAVSRILRDVAPVFLLLTFLWRNGEPRSAIDWEFSRLGRELILGAANLAQAILGVMLVAVVAWAEETIFRRYLILRLQALLGNWLAAAICASFIRRRSVSWVSSSLRCVVGGAAWSPLWPCISFRMHERRHPALLPEGGQMKPAAAASASVLPLDTSAPRGYIRAHKDECRWSSEVAA